MVATRAAALLAAIVLAHSASAQQTTKPPPSAETLKHYECMLRNGQRIANLPDNHGAWYGMLTALCTAKPDYKG